MVYRIFVEKKPEFAAEAAKLLRELREFLNIDSVTFVRTFNRYDAEGMDRADFEAAVSTVFSEPQTDDVYWELPVSGTVFAVEYLPGQFDQRADSAAQCIQLISMTERPRVRTAKVYAIEGDVTAEQLSAIKKHIINPVESREADMEKPATLDMTAEPPEKVPVLTGFTKGADMTSTVKRFGLAMDENDLEMVREYFASENRDPTLAELRVIDTYWSDHCRHTTFLTEIDEARFEHPAAQKMFGRYLAIRKELGVKKPVTLMDLGTIAAKYLKKQGVLKNLDESDEINACTVRITAEGEPWLLLFKNETHNHPTEIEPFGGAATCIGGAIRDPLSGRGYVYQAMRVTGAADPTAPIESTLPGKLPQRRLVTTAAAGYSSYGNQIGLATGLVDELYHPGYVAKHLEIGAVVGAAPAAHVRREVPSPDDVVILLGGRTGRDGCGGATGSSKSHKLSSLEECGAEVQKGNAPEERKLQRLFRNADAARMIKRCNDFGAGGVSVAIGELADGLVIDLDRVPKKYDGLTGTELAISESQERMAVVLDPADVDAFLALAASENIEATAAAKVTEAKRLTMTFEGDVIVDIAREFLDSNGARKHVAAFVARPKARAKKQVCGGARERMEALVSDLNVCSKQGLAERFDSTIGSASVLMPFGGARQKTPAQAMAAKLPVTGRDTDVCSVMAYGFDPYRTEADPYSGAYCAVVESVAKLAAANAPLDRCYLTFQEYFERMGKEPSRFGKPLSALLGALKAQLGLGFAAIGGKDSMSGSFENYDVPPTLVSFAVAVADANELISPEFKRAGSRIALLKPETDELGLPTAESLLSIWRQAREAKPLSAWAVTSGGIAEGLFKMCLGNAIGCDVSDDVFDDMPGALLLELPASSTVGETIGSTTEEYAFVTGGERLDMAALEALYDGRLSGVYPMAPAKSSVEKPPVIENVTRPLPVPTVRTAKPRVLIPVFPGTNCEYDSAAAFERAGAKATVFVLKNLRAADVEESAERFARLLDESEMMFLPGGFSAGDEPDGSGKFITAFLRNPRIADGLLRLDSKKGLMAGICNGFQALVKLGLLPFGEIRDMDETCPTLTYNTIGRHQSRIVLTRIAQNSSPWLSKARSGELYAAPVSHGEGRFVADEALLLKLAANGQIATQYTDENGVPSMDIAHNPNGSRWAIEGITSPDGRILGKMAHSERTGKNLYKNIPLNHYCPLFEGAVDYFK